MAYTPHTLVTFGGTLQERTAGDEIWQCGVRGLNSPGNVPVGDAQLEALVTKIATQVSATQNLLGWFQSVTSRIPTTTKLLWVKAANIGPDGKYTADPAIYTYAVPGVGAATQTVPTFMSLCYTWTTGRTFGRKLRYGRIYPPNASVPVGVGSQVAAGDVTAAVAQAKQLLSALAQSDTEYSFEPAVVSPAGGYEYITGVKVGNVWDVHRSRKDAVAEAYTADVWP